MLAIIAAAAIDGFKAALRRALLRAQLVLAAAIIALIAVVYLSIAGDLWLIPRVGAPEAALLVGAILLAIAGILVTVSGSLIAARPDASTSALGKAIETELRALAQPLTLAALIVGFLLAQRPGRNAAKD